MASDRQQSLSEADASSRPALRRRKRNSERTRVTRACDRCKRRKIKCNGTQPCDFCSRAGAECAFEAAYGRGRLPSIPASRDAPAAHATTARQYRDATTPGSDTPSATEQPQTVPAGSIKPPVTTSGASARTLEGERERASQAATTAAAVQSVRASPEPSQTDLQGHYVGPASGVSFLLRVQKRLHRAISFSQSSSSIFTFGDAPLPDYDPSFCVVLPRADAQRLVERYFDFAMPTYRFLHRQTVQGWFDEFYDTLGVMADTDSAPAKIALLFMVFAQARVYMPDAAGPPDLSARYYLAAEHHLTKERGTIRLASVQARLAQCYFLLSQSRVNHCWSLFGTMAHLALAIGLNRNRRPDATLNRVECECRSRTFWCAYTLDRYLSAALGRPRTFHDEDIDTELPSCVDDQDLLLAEQPPAGLDIPKSHSIMLAPIAHVKLSRIVSTILRDLYSIKPLSMAKRISLTESISGELREWRGELARFLSLDADASLLMPIFQRQRNVLNTAYWHAVILTHRHFLLGNFARLAKPGARSSSEREKAQVDASVRECLVAAKSTVETIDQLTRSNLMFRAYWITAYFAFTATIVLYVYVIQNSGSPAEVYSTYLAAATRCQSQLSAIAEDESLSQRYCLVLEELRLEALRQIKRAQGSQGQGQRQCQGGDSIYGHHSQQPPSQPHDPRRLGQTMGVEDPAISIDDIDINSPSLTTTHYSDQVMGGSEAAPPLDFNGMPASVLTDYTGWGQFASMVSSGLGNLDSFLYQDEVHFE